MIAETGAGLHQLETDGSLKFRVQCLQKALILSLRQFGREFYEMRILLTGSRGFAGSRIMEASSEIIPSPSLRNFNEKDIRRLIEQIRPDYIIHTAAISDIRACESDPDASWHANVELPCRLVHTGVKTILFSSDQVYGGCDKDGPYTEKDASAENTYAVHKLEMENRCLDINPDTVILRASWMYDLPIYGMNNRGNYLMNMLLQREMMIPFSQHRTVTYMREAAYWTLKALHLPGGVYNFGSENDLTMLDLSLWLKKELGLTVNFLDAGTRHSLWMNCQKAKDSGIVFSNAVEGLAHCLQDYHLKV